MTRTTRVLLGLLLLLCATLRAQVPATPSPSAPPNEPAVVEVAGDAVRVRYNGVLIFDGHVRGAEGVRVEQPVAVTSRSGAVDQVIAIHTAGLRGAVELSGTVTASDQAFACESDRPVRAVPIVRHTSGRSRSLLNQAVYDRTWDWVLSVDDQPRTQVRVEPAADSGNTRTFGLHAQGNEIVLRFRPRFYQQHRGLRYFEPWTYRPWPDPVVGWCSWFAFFDRVTEQDIKHTADILAETLAPYGYRYLQIDDGYQRGTGLPELWLKPNEKFPSGLDGLAAYIRGKGLTPGIWTNAAFAQTDYAAAHKEWFVQDRTGQVARGNWIGHALDATAPGALETLVSPIYRALEGMGWEYFKLDALRHLRYEGYNAFREHFDRKHVEPADAFRQYVAAVRRETRPNHFLLACWGIRPELVGLVDGCRIGTDGFSYAGLAQFNSFNNVVWRNDPDHIELSDTEAWRSTMVTSLTGSLFMLTDKPERYQTAFVDPARRAAPVLVTTPGQLYDVDPSRSSLLAKVDAEVSGRDPKPFDAGLTPSVYLYQLDIDRPFESWTVLGRTGGRFEALRFSDLGLDEAKEYLVFEFWERRYLGSFSGAFDPGDLPVRFNSQVFIIRERVGRPQLVATSRHLTGGGVDLDEVQWRDSSLTGRSRVVAGDPYEIYLTEPAGWRLVDVQCEGVTPLPVARQGVVVRAGCQPTASGELRWVARYQRP